MVLQCRCLKDKNDTMKLYYVCNQVSAEILIHKLTENQPTKIISDNLFVFSVVYKAKIQNVRWFQVFKYANLLLFYV